jgi:Cdc6-like AAA superfamily ATPase
MEALGLVVSIVALVESSYKLCDFVSDVKDGGKERMKLLKEVSNLCCTLDNLKERVDTSETEQTALLRILDKKDGPIHQCTEIVDNLTKKLTSSEVRVGRLVQRLKWNFDKREVLEAVEQLHRIQATITQALQQVIYTVVGQMQTTTTRTLGFIEERQSKDIRDWLSPLNFAAQQEVVFEDHCVGTGRIILQSSGFAAFKELTKSVMWCRGPPGAGKTYQASIIAQHLVQGDASTGERCPVLVVYCRYDDPACQVLTNILGDLVRQCLVSPYIPDKLSALYKRHISSDTRPTCKELVEILAEQIGTSKHCRIVLDALDEFGTSSDRALLLQALASINATLESGSHLNNATQSHSNEPGGVSLLITSRHVQDIDAALRAVWLHDEKGSLSRDEYRYKTYELSPSTEDIRRYLDWRIGKEFTLKMMTTQRTELNKMIAVSIIEASGSLYAPETPKRERRH